jgi:hypothetical protein
MEMYATSCSCSCSCMRCDWLQGKVCPTEPCTSVIILSRSLIIAPASCIPAGSCCVSAMWISSGAYNILATQRRTHLVFVGTAGPCQHPAPPACRSGSNPAAHACPSYQAAAPPPAVCKV